MQWHTHDFRIARLAAERRTTVRLDHGQAFLCKAIYCHRAATKCNVTPRWHRPSGTVLQRAALIRAALWKPRVQRSGEATKRNPGLVKDTQATAEQAVHHHTAA